MIRFLVFAVLSLNVLGFAHADEIDDRISRRREADDARYEQESANRRYQGNASRLRVYQNFAAVHGGATDGNCTVGVKNCDYNYYRRGNLCMYSGSERVSFGGFNPAADQVLRTCRLTLNDGLACDIGPNNKDNDLGQEKWFTADCYDRAGNYSQLSFGANGGKIAPKKYPPRIRVGRGKCSYECDGSDGKRYLYSTPYCPAWNFGETLPNGVSLSCAR